MVMKKTIFLIIVIGLISESCTMDKESRAKLDELKVKANLETQNKAIIQKITHALNQRDTTYVILYASNCKYYTPSANPTPVTIAIDLKNVKNAWQAFPDIKWKIEEMIADYNMVVIRYSVKGTHLTGKKIEFGGMLMDRFENGKIVEQREDYDELGFNRQLGMELRPAGNKK